MKPKFIIPQGTELPQTRKHLNADALFGLILRDFAKVKDPRPGNTQVSLVDTLMSGFAVFSLKDASLLAFDQRRKECDPNLKQVFGIEQAPCDTQMREILDQIDPALLRPTFKRLFAQLQRGKALEQMRFLDRYYLISGDGTGYYYSLKKGHEFCLTKKVKGLEESAYHQQFYGACLVHPDFREVIPFCPEPIVKQDGQAKNDSERNAARRFLQGFRADHPHLPAVIVEDGLHSNAPHIRDLQAQRLHYILGAKENDHEFLFMKAFEEEQGGRATNLTIDDPDNPKKRHNFFFVNGVPLNKSNQDVRVNFLEYWEIGLDDQGQEIPSQQLHFGWITDLEITKDNVYDLMRGGRARWKIENETFNTLKNQGYHLDHNFGLGKQYLSLVFMTLTMLAFMVDQIQQLCCGLFRGAWEKVGSKRALWEKIRGFFGVVDLDSMETLLKLLCFGFQRPKGAGMLNTS
jgi:Transposase DDE domain